MDNGQIITYNKGETYLILDKDYKSGKYIGKVTTLVSNGVILKVYIFPDDLKEGKKRHMSMSEVFETDIESIYKFKGAEIRVTLTDIATYVKKKYVQKLDFSAMPIYYVRQKYLKNGKFEPNLQKTCYCREYFNPDDLFKICNCGSYFHPMCFMKNPDNKCWNPGCTVDCSKFFSLEENAEKINYLKKLENKSHNQAQSVEYDEDFFLNEQEIKNINNHIIDINEMSEFNTAELFKQSKKKSNQTNQKKGAISVYFSKAFPSEKEKEIKIKTEPIINLGIKTENNASKNSNKAFDTTIYEKKNQGYTTTIKVEPNQVEEMKKKTEIERENTKKVMFENLMHGIKFLKKDRNANILENFLKENPSLRDNITFIKEGNQQMIEIKYREVANSIENYLYEICEQKTNTSYFAFLQAFGGLIKNSRKILFRVILGDLTPEEVSKFKGDDFLPEEEKKAKEELKRKEIQKMQFKGPNIIQLISNKGRMLTEIQDNIDPIKNNLYNENQINLDEGKKNSSKYYDKINALKAKYPNMLENDIKSLVDAKEPSVQDVENRINSIIQENLDAKEKAELLTYRKKRLDKKADRNFKNLKGKNDVEMKKKCEEYIKNIAFEINSY